MRRSLRRKWRNARNQMKNDLWAIMNPALAAAIRDLYAAYRLHTHVHEIWYLLGHKHRAAYKEYNDTLFDKHITGNFDFMPMMYWIDKNFHDKHNMKVPGRLAIGDSYSVAIRYHKYLRSKSINGEI